MHSQDIAAAIRKSGSTFSSISRKLDISQVSVGKVVRGQIRSKRIETEICEVTALPLHTLWPQWHAPTNPCDDPGASMTSLERLLARLQAEFSRLNLDLHVVAGICHRPKSLVTAWFRPGSGVAPDVVDLLSLGGSTRIDLIYVMTGNRGGGRG